MYSTFTYTDIVSSESPHHWFNVPGLQHQGSGTVSSNVLPHLILYNTHTHTHIVTH